MSGTAPTLELDRPEIDAAITERFGDRRDLAVAYADLLSTLGVERGMIGPREAERVWERHLLNSAALASLVPEAARVIDLGSGAGLPGIPLAIARPDLEVVLVEPMQRRVRFLDECLSRLTLPQISVHRGRGEAGIAPPGQVVVVRAVAALDAIVRLSSRLLTTDGVILALKGQSAAAEVAQVKRELGLDAEILSVPAPGTPATIVRITGDLAAFQPLPATRSTRASRAKR